LRLLVALGAAVALPAAAHACPGCQNPNLPMVRSGGVHLGEGELKLGATLAAQPIWVRHDAGCADVDDCDEVPAQPTYVHDQFILPSELRATVDWGLTGAFGVEAQIPVRLVYTTIDYETPAGDPYEPLDPDVHHRDETLVGLGDPQVSVRWGGVLGDAWWVVGRVGASLPLGRTEPDPFAAGDRGEAHQHIQFGTGTFDPLVGLEVARGFGRLQMAAYGQAQAALYENEHGFRAGATSLVGLQGGWRAGERLVVQSSFEWFRQGPETWDGEEQQDGILGRDELLIGLGTAFSFGGPQYSALVRVPVYRQIHQGAETEEGELTSPVSVALGIQWTL
jgi:hypothetical protein